VAALTLRYQCLVAATTIQVIRPLMDICLNLTIEHTEVIKVDHDTRIAMKNTAKIKTFNGLSLRT
jgi:hypothetical protein